MSLTGKAHTLFEFDFFSVVSLVLLVAVLVLL